MFVQEQFNSYHDDHSMFEQCLCSTGELLMLDHGAIFFADRDGAEDAPAPWHGEDTLVAD